MKKLLIISIMTLVSNVLIHGQKNLTGAQKTNYTRFFNRGKEYFEAERTNDALAYFKKAEAIDPENWKLRYWLAACHHELNSYLAAEQYINSAKSFIGEKDQGDATFYELEGKINHRLGKVENALEAYKRAATLLGSKTAKEFGITGYINQCELVLVARKQGISVIRKPLSTKINTVEDEYAPILIKNGEVLFFTARRPETKGENLNPDDMRYFEDMYRANWNPKTEQYEMDYNFFNEINTNGFDALSYVNSTGTYALMTINTSLAEKTTKSSDIFELSTDQPLVWEGPTIIQGKGVNTDYFEGGACITEGAEEGDIMIFISDRKADVSGLDLYTCAKNESGYGEVKPLPKSINSLGNETTPWLTPDGKYLFFSSDELPGYGGYDVFYCVNESGTWSAPLNLGATVNTVNNDTHFRLTGSNNKAIYASVADQNGFYSYDLFELDLSSGNFPFLK